MTRKRVRVPFFDAVVIGGGPAGSLSALVLARAGWRVCLVERGERDRPKACGHCLHPGALRRLDGLGLLDDVRAGARGATTRLRLHLAGAPPRDVPFATDRAGLVIDRGSFDQMLRDRAAEAGASIVQPAAARLVSTNGVAVVELNVDGKRRRVSCGLVVGADGLRSAVADAAGVAGRTGASGRPAYGFAIDIDADGVEHEPDAIEMFVVPGGYLGIVGYGGGMVHVAGFVHAHRAVPGPREFVRSVARRFTRVAGLDGNLGRLLGAGPMPHRPRAVVAERVVLVGDAAGYVEPFTGEGMSWAIESACLLGRAVADRPAGQWSHAAATAYSRAWRRCIGARQRRCRRVVGLVRRPNVMRLIAAVLGHTTLPRRALRRVVDS